MVSVTYDQDASDPFELCISTTLVVNNLPQKESQSAIVRIIKKLFGEDNIVGVSFGHTPKNKEDRQAGWCHIQCFNAMVYTEWLNKSTYILRRRVDFIPHHGGIDCLELNETTICLAQAPTQKAIAQKIQMMHNFALTNPPITEKNFNRRM